MAGLEFSGVNPHNGRRCVSVLKHAIVKHSGGGGFYVAHCFGVNKKTDIGRGGASAEEAS